MSRKTTNLTPIQARKQLLVVESELNRTQLVTEWHEVRAGAKHLAEQLSAMTSLAESAIKIGASCAKFFKDVSSFTANGDNKKTSWMNTFTKFARTGLSFLFPE